MKTHSITLPDGRSLAYAEYGIPDGRVVLWMHGLPGSRRDWSVGGGPALLTELGLRFIAPDRPGFGRSSPHSGRTYASFVADLALLTARLGIESGIVLGYSGGAPYALAVGAEEYCGTMRVDRVVLVSPIGPRSTPQFSRGLGQTDKVMLMLSRFPPAARLAMRRAVRSANSDPDTFLRTVRKEFSASANDLRLLDVPDTAERVATAFVEATAQGAGGCVSDWALWRNDWALDLNGSQAPIHIWHGDDDPLVPLRHAQHLQRTCPRARLDVLSGEGHLHDDNTWRQVLTASP